MSWIDIEASANAALLGVFREREPIARELFAGFQGIFHPTGQPATDGAWPGQSPGWQPSDQPQPYALALATDLAALAPTELERGEVLTIRGASYRLTRIHPADDSGWVRLDLLLLD